MPVKYIQIIMAFALTVALSFVSAAYCDASAMDDTQDSKAVFFLAAPAKGLAAIYSDYHDWKIKNGIERALSALAEVEHIYANNPKAVLDDKGLKLNEAGQIKSTLHTMLGMLYYRKALLVQRDADGGAVEQLMSKVDSGQEITDADLERVALEAEKGDAASDNKNSLVTMAVNELVAASKADPLNPSPHYQLAIIYSALDPGGPSAQAEQEYFIAAELSYKEGSREDALKVLATIKEINPESEYARRLEAMVAK